MTPNIYIAFRFHGNFYHSYRGDTPDELGFGKDIRIIRHIITILDELNADGIPVCGTWDFENYFSFEKIIPEYSPEIITNLQRRVRQGHDDIQIMSYNNGLVSAHTAHEFEENIRRSLTNPQGSGVLDLFGDNFKGMVRPQEMMYTPIHLKLYKSLGVDSISLFYSAIPFNGFSNFVPPLSLEERYNPLTLTYPGIEETMTLVPCYNTGDLADHITLRRWVTHMRTEQLKLDTPKDLLLTIDMDADDDFWVGYDVPVLKNLLPTIGGLRGLVENVVDLDYVIFTTPDRYLKSHAPVNTITIRQDTADGSFDGISSWAEKWSNQRLWTGLERSRILALQTKRLLGGELSGEIKNLLDQSFDSRLKALSTTHFGMAAPVMNLTREKAAAELIQNAFNSAKSAFDIVKKSVPASFSLFDYVRGESTDLIQFHAKPSQALVRLSLKESAPSDFAISDENGKLVPSTIIKSGNARELLFVDNFEPESQKDYKILESQSSPFPENSVTTNDQLLENEFIRLEFDHNGHPASLKFMGGEFSAGRFLDSQITYNNKNYRVEKWEETETLSENIIGLKHSKGIINIQDKHDVQFEREILIASGLPYVYVKMKVDYPLTENKNYGRGHAARLEQAYDNRWQEVIPCQISPNLKRQADSLMKVWKFNYCNHMSSFSLDYSQFSSNIELDSVNNHITYSWAAVTDGKMGLLVAQSADVNSSMAFCPLRTRRQGGVSRVLLNPFGSYWGKQYRYSTADTGFGKFLAVTMSAADHINPYAPSYNGRTQEFSLLIAPYCGDSPPVSIQNDAEAFSYPYIFETDESYFAPSPHQNWDTEGLGKPPQTAPQA